MSNHARTGTNEAHTQCCNTCPCKRGGQEVHNTCLPEHKAEQSRPDDNMSRGQNEHPWLRHDGISTLHHQPMKAPRKRWEHQRPTAKRLTSRTITEDAGATENNSKAVAEEKVGNKLRTETNSFSFKFSGVRLSTQSPDLKEECDDSQACPVHFFVSKLFSCACIFAHAWLFSSFTWMVSNLTCRDLTNNLLHPLLPHSPLTFSLCRDK